MEETLYQLTETLQFWVVYGFLPYSLLVCPFKWNGWINPEWIAQVDRLVCRVVILCGRLIAGLIFLRYLVYTPEQEAWRPYSIGSFEFYMMPHWFLFPIITVLLVTQLLINAFLREQLWYRVFVGLAAFFVTQHFLLLYGKGGNKILVNSWEWHEGVLGFLFLFLPGLLMAGLAVLLVFSKQLRRTKNS